MSLFDLLKSDNIEDKLEKYNLFFNHFLPSIGSKLIETLLNKIKLIP